MKRLFTVVTCGGCLVAHSRASASGWGGAGRKTGSGGAWANIPPNSHEQEENCRSPVDHPPTPAAGNGWGPVGSDQNAHANGQPGAAAGYVGQEGHDDSNLGFHEELGYHHYEQQYQQQFHDPSHTPHPLSWSGQQYDPPSQQHQQQPHPHYLQHPHSYNIYHLPQQRGTPYGGGEPLRLGTKWRSIVSRVRDTMRPLQAYDTSRPGRGWDGGGIGRTYSPPGSSWVGSAAQPNGHARPPGYVRDQAPSNEYGSYGNEQRGDQVVPHDPRPGLPVYEKNASPYINQGEHLGPHPTESVDQRDPPAFSAQVRMDYEHSRAWEGTPSDSAFQHDPNMVSDNAFASDQGSSAERGVVNSGVGGDGNEGFSGYTAQGVGVSWDESASVAMQDGHGAMEEEFSPPAVKQESEGNYVSRSAMVGKGWAASGVSATPSVIHQQEQRLGEGWGGKEHQINVASVPAAATATTADELTSTETRGHVGEIHSTFHSMPSSPTWTPPSDARADDDGLLDGGVVVEGLRAEPGSAPDERRMAPQEQEESIHASGRADSIHLCTPAGGTLTDTMPNSADHGMEEVDWGEDVAEGSEEEGDTTGLLDGKEGRLEQNSQEEDEDEALIRELERMDGIVGGEILGGGGGAREDSTPVIVSSDEWREQAMDAEVEHRLDALFESILVDDETGPGDYVECPASPESSDDDPAFASAPLTTPPCVLPGNAASGMAKGKSAAGEFKLGETYDSHGLDPSVPVDESPSTIEIRAEEQKVRLDKEKLQTEPVTTDPTAVGQELESAVVLSELEQESEEEEEQENPADVSIVDPIELPPSAATDEIWNDQHLQDQLDAYWEQSRRGLGRDLAGAGGGLGASSPVGGQQIATYGGDPRVTYGPGDWVGKASEIEQEPLPGTVDGVARMVREPLLGAHDGVVGASWVASPRLFQGNLSPINIYGNVHVHLDGGQHEQQEKASPSSELSARERYFSQGETSWSGSGRGSYK